MEIEIKQVGQNINLIIDGEKISKKFVDKTDREEVKEAVAKYNKAKKNRTKKALNNIKSLMSKEQVGNQKQVPDKVQNVVFKQVGQNINIEIGGKKYSKKFADKEARERVKQLLNDVNNLTSKSFTKAKQKNITRLFNKEETKSKAKSNKEDKSNVADIVESVKQSKKSSKNTISGKQLGQNIIITINNQKYSKRFKDKKERQEVLELARKDNSQETVDKLLELMSKEKLNAEEKVSKAIKKNKNSEKAPDSLNEKSKEEQLKEARKLLEADGYTVKKKSTSSSTPSTRRGREY